MFDNTGSTCFRSLYSSMQIRRTTEGWLRLGVGIVLNVALLLFSGPAARSGGYNREAHFDLVLLALAAPALVTIIPLYWRGKPWQAAVAFPCFGFLLLSFWVAVSTILNH